MHVPAIKQLCACDGSGGWSNDTTMMFAAEVCNCNRFCMCLPAITQLTVQQRRHNATAGGRAPQGKQAWAGSTCAQHTTCIQFGMPKAHRAER
jgi:hypothetical protein